jgi:trehalose-6-phosphate synthase
MALKLSIGFQKKVGLPDYGSQGACCAVEFEIDASLLQSDLVGFQEKARRAFSACQQAVNDQLAKSGANGPAPPTNGQNPNGHAAPSSNGHGTTNGNGYARSGSSGAIRQATQSQARAIRAIAGRQRLDLARLLGDRFNVGRPEDLTIRDASSLIDELKAPANGQGGQA